MKWYVAHLVMVVEWKKPGQKHFPLWENIILLQAGSEEEAFAFAEKRGKEDEGDEDGSFQWAGNPARWVFGGVRKMTSCSESSKRPGNGTEITFLELEASSREMVRKYLEGRPVSLKVMDRFEPSDIPSSPRLVS